MTMGDLLRSSLRLRPDRIVVGEVRGAEALTLIKAWNTGHPGGICTVHANDALSGLMRIEQAAAEGTLGWVPRAQIAEAIQVVVFIGRGPEGRRVEQILRVRDQLTRAGEYDVVEVGSWRKAA
jgi:type IV secretion system protein VirB11